MKKCEECGKDLGIFEGYRHMTLGKGFLLCSSCFDLVDESLARWREFISSYAEFFKKGSPYDSLQLNPKKIQAGFVQIKEKFDNILIGEEL